MYNLWITLEPVDNSEGLSRTQQAEVGVLAGTGRGLESVELLLYPIRYKKESKQTSVN